MIKIVYVEFPQSPLISLGYYYYNNMKRAVEEIENVNVNEYRDRKMNGYFNSYQLILLHRPATMHEPFHGVYVSG